MRLPYYFFIVLITNLISNNLLASTHFPLPAQYPLEKISITISNQSGKDNSENYQISINGNGNSFFSQNKEKQPLNITNDTLLELLNDFYAIHFFEIADTFTVKKQVTLKNNKTVTTLIKKESNTSSKRVCIQLRSYKKCVTIVDNQPLAVDQIVNKIETLLRPAHH
ncbi:MAG: hypothetical protein Q8Q54_15650 [Methylococcales bacterium]|nr:hypothetical protein [Methylococcales bacterium]